MFITKKKFKKNRNKALKTDQKLFIVDAQMMTNILPI